MQKVPVLLLTGFLGSGKTTFINWLLQKNPNKKISLILNEFGDIKLESQFITEEAGGEVAELANGCMCCVAKSDIPRVINYILEHSPQTEQIVIEASGLSDPDPVLESLRSQEIANKIRLDTVVCIVDVLNFESTQKDHPIVLSQIGDADIILLNKTKNTDPETVTRIKNSIERIGIGTTVLKWNEQLDSSLFLEPSIAQTQNKQSKPTLDQENHVHQHYSQAWFKSSKQIDITALSKIMRQLPKAIIRAKGIINWQGKKVLLQYVGTKLDFIETTWENDEQQTTAILFLGLDFDTNKLLTSLKACEQNSSSL